MFDLLFPKHWSTLKKLIWLKAAALSSAVVKTVTAAIVHITDALALPAKSLTVNVEPIQAGSGDPSPDNVRPISGWTGANVTRTGKNVIPNLATSGTSKGITYTVNADKSISLSGTATRNVFITLFENLLIKAGTYTLKRTNDSDIEIDIRKETATGTNYMSAKLSDTTNIFAADVLIACVVKIPSGKNADGITIYPQLELGSTATAYEPYQGNTYTIQLGDTVYGGTLDVTTGELTVTHGQIASYAGEALPGAWISDRDVYAVGTTPTTGAQVVYELATPIEITLTPTQIEMFLGENNLWADAGDLTLTYYADGNASDAEALGILLGGRYTPSDDVTDKEALDIILGGTE